MQYLFSVSVFIEWYVSPLAFFLVYQLVKIGIVLAPFKECLILGNGTKIDVCCLAFLMLWCFNSANCSIKFGTTIARCDVKWQTIFFTYLVQALHRKNDIIHYVRVIWPVVYLVLCGSRWVDHFYKFKVLHILFAFYLFINLVYLNSSIGTNAHCWTCEC